MSITLGPPKLKRGPVRRDDLYDRLENLKVKQEMEVADEKERNRCLRFARANRMFIITRKKWDGRILVWRQS